MARGKKLGYGNGSAYRDKTDGRWRGAYVQADGRRRKVSGDTRAEVVEKLEALRREELMGRATGDTSTLGGWIRRYDEKILAHKSPTTRANHQWALAQTAPLHTKKLQDLTPDHVEDLLSDLSTRGPASSTKRPSGRGADRGRIRGPLGKSSLMRVRSVLAECLAEAEKRRMVTWNVAKVAVLPIGLEEPEGRRALEVRQVQALRKALDGHRDEAMVLTGLVLGLRPGEILGLAWENVDLDGRTISVTQAVVRLPDGSLSLKDPKTKESNRTLRMPPDLVSAYRRHRNAQRVERMAAQMWDDTYDLVFPTSTGTIRSHSDFQRVVRSLGDTIGVSALKPHELRHTCASLLVDSGVSLGQVSNLLGHKDLVMVSRVYTHPVREVVDLTDVQTKLAQGGVDG